MTEPLIPRFHVFMWDERMRFETRDNNYVGGAFGEILRYRRFLEVIKDTHTEAAHALLRGHEELQASLKQGSGELDENQRMLSTAIEFWNLRLLLEVESFYLFAKVLLDKVAHALEVYFGAIPRYPFKSHDNLTSRFAAYVESKNLRVSDDLLPRMVRLKQDVSDFRDQHIAHQKSPRVLRGFMWSGDAGSARMIVHRLYPTEHDKQIESQPVGALLADLDGYLDAFMKLIQTNRDRTVLAMDVERARRLGESV